MKTLIELISRSWKKMKQLRRIEDFEIVEFDHQPYIDYLKDDNSELK